MEPASANALKSNLNSTSERADNLRGEEGAKRFQFLRLRITPAWPKITLAQAVPSLLRILRGCPQLHR